MCLISAAFAEEMTVETTFLPASCDRKTKVGDHLEMHYTGTIDRSSKTGTPERVFDTSITRQQPFDFTLGTGQVIKGWDQGLLDMCQGEKRTLILPPEYGYGDRGAGNDIPGGATLRFTVELIAIYDDKPQMNLFAEIDKDRDNKIHKDELYNWFRTKRGADKVPDELWEQEDKDKDGFISWAEFSGPKGDGSAVDKEL